MDPKSRGSIVLLRGALVLAALAAPVALAGCGGGASSERHAGTTTGVTIHVGSAGAQAAPDVQSPMASPRLLPSSAGAPRGLTRAEPPSPRATFVRAVQKACMPVIAHRPTVDRSNARELLQESVWLWKLTHALDSVEPPPRHVAAVADQVRALADYRTALSDQARLDELLAADLGKGGDSRGQDMAGHQSDFNRRTRDAIIRSAPLGPCLGVV